MYLTGSKLNMKPAGMYAWAIFVEGFEACRSRSVLDQCSVCDPPTEDLCSPIKVILRNHVFVFNNYHQDHGTAMGTKMYGPSVSQHVHVLVATAISQHSEQKTS